MCQFKPTYNQQTASFPSRVQDEHSPFDFHLALESFKHVQVSSIFSSTKQKYKEKMDSRKQNEKTTAMEKEKGWG